MSKKIFATILLSIILAINVIGQDETELKKAEIPKLKPSIENGKYGTHDRHTFDFWKPDSKKPTPLIVYIHGGGFVNGSKEKLSPNLLNQLLKAGFAVMAINYRLLPEVVYPQHYMDCARAIQFARYNAKDWNIDKTKVVATGSSAGGLTSLWLGFHEDLADTNNADPVLRESTRLRAMAVFSAQTTLVPEILKVRLGEAVLKHNFAKGVFFGLKSNEVNSPNGQKLFKEASPMEHLTKDDPPVWAFYSVADKPMTNETTVSDAIHHPYFGKVLKEEMDKLKIECKLRHKDDGQNVNGDLIQFLLKNIK